ncbi:MAG: hypothetical protein ABIL66_11300 [candidate division WOR-3 bacterium]
MCYFKELENTESPLFPLYKRGTERDFIDLTFLVRLLKGTVYFEGNGNRTLKIVANFILHATKGNRKAKALPYILVCSTPVLEQRL